MGNHRRQSQQSRLAPANVSRLRDCASASLTRMTFGEFFGFIVINAVLFGLLQKLATMWLKARLDESIRHEYNVALANLQNE